MTVCLRAVKAENDFWKCCGWERVKRSSTLSSLFDCSLHVCITLYSDGLEEDSEQLFGDSEEQDVAAGEGAGKEVEHVLWVDKYSPRHFTELLSDDVSM